MDERAKEIVMKKLYFPLLVLVMLGMLVGCAGAKTSDKLNGTWLVDIGASLDASGVVWNDSAKAMAEALMAGMGYVFDTKADKLTIMGIGLGSAQTVSYKVAAEDDNSVTITVDGDPLIFEFIDENTIKVTDLDGALTIYRKS